MIADSELFRPGAILRINQFDFGDGGNSRDKYVIGLCSNDGELYYIYSLATSKNHRGVAPKGQGCNVESGVNYWYFQPGVALDEDGFSFDLPTYLFFNGNVRKRSYAELRKMGSDGSPFGV